MPIFGSKRHREKETHAAFAQLHGLQYSEQDAFGLAGLPFPVFSEGDDHGCQDVVYGTWNGLNAWAFVLWTRDTDTDGNHAYSYSTCAAAPLPADCPSIDIHAVGALTRAMRSVGLRGQQVPFESEEFNKRFRVTSAEPKFATEVVPPEMIEWLLANGDDWHFEVNRNYILVHRRREKQDPDLTAKVLDLVTGFYNHIPDVVASLHRLNLQPQLTPEQIYEMARARAVGFNPAAAAVGFAVGSDTPVQVSTTVETHVIGPPDATSWLPGHMTIHSIQDLGGAAGAAGEGAVAGRMVQLDADITPQGGQPFHVSQTALVMPQHAARVVPGATIPVKVDPMNPMMFTMDWDAS
jgi:hypothetical protein